MELTLYLITRFNLYLILLLLELKRKGIERISRIGIWAHDLLPTLGDHCTCVAIMIHQL